MAKKKLVIGVATYGRSEYLKLCLTSLAQLQLPDNTLVHLVLVDNNKEPQAEPSLNSIEFPFSLHYFHETERGIVHARNRILDASENLAADYLAFIDDDETVDKNWLVSAMGSLSENFSIVTGPCEFLFERPSQWISHSRIFRSKSPDSGPHFGTASTRNVVMKMDIIAEHKLRFEKKLNWVGGSDTYFFIQARDLGYRTYWNNQMPVIERIPKSRSNFRWLLKRNLRLGGGRVHRQRLQKSNIVVAVRESFVGIWFILKGTSQSLLLFWLDHHFLRGIERATRGMGIFYALLGFDFKEYKEHHGR